MKQRIFCISLLSVSLFSSICFAQQASLVQCQSLKQSIEKYQHLRRKGGKATVMERWKDRLRYNTAQFRASQCQKYKRQLE